MNRNTLIIGTGVLLLLTGVVLSTTTALGANQPVEQNQPSEIIQTEGENVIEINSTYLSSDTESEAINVVIDVQPEEEEITDIVLGIRNGNDAFINYDSFSVTVEPSGAAGINESLGGERNNPRKQYEIDSLEPGERVTISFTAYPRTLKNPDSEIESVLVDYEFLRQGITIPDSPPGFVTEDTDISGSPHYTDDTGGSGTSLFTLPSLLIGIVALAVGVGAGYFVTGTNGSNGISPLRLEDYSNELGSIKNKADAKYDNEEIVEELNDIIEKIEDDKDNI